MNNNIYDFERIKRIKEGLVIEEDYEDFSLKELYRIMCGEDYVTEVQFDGRTAFEALVEDFIEHPLHKDAFEKLRKTECENNRRILEERKKRLQN